MKMTKMMLACVMALCLTACVPTDPNAIYPNAEPGFGFVPNPPYHPNQGPTVNVNITYPGYKSLGNYKVLNGGMVPLVASNQAQVMASIEDSVNETLTDMGFKLPGLFAGSRTLNITISNLGFNYSADGKTITATCTIQLKAAAGTFDHWSKTYSNSMNLTNNPPATRSQIIQAVGQMLNTTLQQMMSDPQMIQFIR